MNQIELWVFGKSFAIRTDAWLFSLCFQLRPLTSLLMLRTFLCVYRVNKQRMEKKKLDRGERSSMTTERLQALQSVGFQWAKLKGDVSWNQKYTELLEYRSVFGDCNVPTKYRTNPALGRWVSTQRSQFKEFQAGLVTHITDQRISHLEKIGFRWSMMEEEEENNCTNENSLRDGSEADAIFSRSMRVEKAKRWEYDKSRTSSRHSSINRVTSV